MNSENIKRTDFYVAIWGLILVSGSLFFWSKSVFFGAGLGAILACANWLAFRFTLNRLLMAKNKARVRWGVLLAIKTLTVFAAVGAIVTFVPIDVISFVIGFSSLVLGIFSSSFTAMLFDQEEAVSEKEF